MRRTPGRQQSFLRRVVTNTPILFGWPRRSSAKPKPTPHGSALRVETKFPAAQHKPLPARPSEWFGLYEDAVHSVTSEGFKKRVARRDTISLRSSGTARDSVTPIPDGVFKGELQLRNELANTIDWPGLSLSVSLISGLPVLSMPLG